MPCNSRRKFKVDMQAARVAKTTEKNIRKKPAFKTAKIRKPRL